MRPPYAVENAAEREHLLRLADHLTDADLVRPLPDGWTVATKFVHLAFWDLYYLALVQKWERAGFSPSPANADAINEAVQALSQALPPREVLRLVCDAAEAIDRKIEMLSPELAAAIEQGGYPRILYRALHRREHLKEITDTLGLTA